MQITYTRTHLINQSREFVGKVPVATDSSFQDFLLFFRGALFSRIQNGPQLGQLVSAEGKTALKVAD